MSHKKGMAFLYAQARIWRSAADAACGQRNGQGENLPCLIAKNHRR